MVKHELYGIRQDGVRLIITYSTDKKQLLKMGTDELYEEVIDIEDAPYEYIETDILIEEEQEDEEEIGGSDV